MKADAHNTLNPPTARRARKSAAGVSAHPDAELLATIERAKQITAQEREVGKKIGAYLGLPKPKAWWLDLDMYDPRGAGKADASWFRERRIRGEAKRQAAIEYERHFNRHGMGALRDARDALDAEHHALEDRLLGMQPKTIFGALQLFMYVFAGRYNLDGATLAGYRNLPTHPKARAAALRGRAIGDLGAAALRQAIRTAEERRA